MLVGYITQFPKSQEILRDVERDFIARSELNPTHLTALLCDYLTPQMYCIIKNILLSCKLTPILTLKVKHLISVSLVLPNEIAKRLNFKHVSHITVLSAIGLDKHTAPSQTHAIGWASVANLDSYSQLWPRLTKVNLCRIYIIKPTVRTLSFEWCIKTFYE